MEFSKYLYLAGAPLLALGLLALFARNCAALRRESDQPTRLELVLLLLASLLGLYVIYFNFYAQTSYFAYGIGDFGSDTSEQYVPYLCGLIGRIRGGTFSLWNFEYSLGVPLAAVQTWTLDPFNLFLVPFVLIMGDAHLSLGLALAQSLKILASVLLFDFLLTRYCRLPLSRILGSLLYGFSGFMVMFGQHYWLGSAYPVFTLSVLLFERYLERRAPARFVSCTLGVALLMCWSPYIAFMVLLFDAIYLLFRIPVVKGAGGGRLLRETLWLCLPVVCGILLSGVALLPYVWFLMGESPRTGAQTGLGARIVEGLTGFSSPQELLLTLSRMLGSGLINNGGGSWDAIASVYFDPYESIMLGYSAGIFVLLSQFLHWAIRDAPSRARRLIVGACALIVVFCANHFLPLVFTGFVRVQYRCSFILNVPIIAAAAVGWEQRVATGRLAVRPLVGALLLSLVVLLWSCAHAVTNRLVCLYYLLALGAAGLVLLVGWHRGALSGLALCAVLACFFSTSVVDAFSYTNLRGLITGESFPYAQGTGDQDTLDALAYLKEHDDTFYRVDKTYSDWTPNNDALIQHYFGVSAYDSSPDADVDEFFETLWEEAVSRSASWTKGYKYDPDEPTMAQLLGLKYVLSKEPLDLRWLTLETSCGSVYVYRCEGVESIASVRGSVVSESAAEALGSSAERRELLADAVIVSDEDAERLESDLGRGVGTDVDADVATGITSFASFSQDSSSSVSGSITTSQDAVVCLAIPYTATWSVTVDGEPVETFRANYGFVGFELPTGEHKIQASYTPKYLPEGGAMSALGLAATAASVFLVARQRRRPPSEPCSPRHPEGLRPCESAFV